MIEAPTLDNESQRAEALDAAMCAFVPREERFDRITRTVKRLLDVPLALISIVERDVQWFRSAQGLLEAETPRSISFCGHAIASKKPLVVPDATSDPRFWDNPLVTSSPHIRAYLGIPLSIAPGVRVGTLCALDTRVREFTAEDVAGMEDLAAMAEAELRLDAMADAQKRLLATLNQMERRASLDPATGCWTVRGFRQLVSMAVDDAARAGTALALCYVRVNNFAALTANSSPAQMDLIRQLLAQVLRRRLPEAGALASLGQRDFCALVPGATPLEVEERLAEFTFPKARLDTPGLQLDLELELAFGLAFLHEATSASPATELWATALARLEA
ncbi:MAG: GAF domain-containing protein [Ramlibacter sp.]